MVSSRLRLLLLHVISVMMSHYRMVGEYHRRKAFRMAVIQRLKSNQMLREESWKSLSHERTWQYMQRRNRTMATLLHAEGKTASTVQCINICGMHPRPWVSPRFGQWQITAYVRRSVVCLNRMWLGDRPFRHVKRHRPVYVDRST